MSYTREDRQNKTPKELQDELKTQKIRKYIKNDKYILLRDIQKALDLSKDKDIILTKIMHGFWKGYYNLYSLPHFSDIFIDLKYVEYSLIVLTREMFRSLLSSEVTGHKNRTKSRPDLITSQLSWNDGENDFYKTFLNEEWMFYQRILNRIKRDYRNTYKQKKDDLARLKASMLETKDDLDLLRNLMLEIHALEYDINMPVNSDYINFYTLDALSMEINDFISLINSSNITPFTEQRNIITSLEHVLDSKKTRKGHQLDGSFIFMAYMGIQEAAVKECGKPKSIIEVSKEIYIKYYQGSQNYESKINSPASIKTRICEQIRVESKKRIKVMRDRDNISDTDIINILPKEFYISSSHEKKLKEYIKEVLAEMDEFPTACSLWFFFDENGELVMRKLKATEETSVDRSYQYYQRSVKTL